MDSIKDGWFTETCTLWPGQAMSLEVEEVLYHQKSKFQDVMVFKRSVIFVLYIINQRRFTEQKRGK